MLKHVVNPDNTSKQTEPAPDQNSGIWILNLVPEVASGTEFRLKRVGG